MNVFGAGELPHVPNVGRRQDEGHALAGRSRAQVLIQPPVLFVWYGDVVHDHARLVLPHEGFELQLPVAQVVRERRDDDEPGVFEGDPQEVCRVFARIEDRDHVSAQRHVRSVGKFWVVRQ